MSDLTTSDKSGGNNNYDILIVDDSKYIIELATQIIRSKGFICKAVNNLLEAEREFMFHSPKLIFLDVNLPDSNGYDFCKKVRSNEKQRNTLIYYFTGIPEAEIAIKTLETKADGYLKKPFDLSDFNDILAQLDKKAIV